MQNKKIFGRGRVVERRDRGWWMAGVMNAGVEIFALALLYQGNEELSCSDFSLRRTLSKMAKWKGGGWPPTN